MGKGEKNRAIQTCVEASLSLHAMFGGLLTFEIPNFPPRQGTTKTTLQKKYTLNDAIWHAQHYSPTEKFNKLPGSDCDINGGRLTETIEPSVSINHHID